MSALGGGGCGHSFPCLSMRERLAIAARKTVGSPWRYPALGVLVELAYVIDAASLHRTPSALSFLLAVVSGAGVVLCGRRPLGGAFAVAMTFVATALFGVGDSAPDVSFLAPAIAAYAVAAHADWEGAATGLVVVLGSTESAGIRSGNWVPWIYVALAPWVVGRILASRRRLVRQLEERTRELDGERGAFAGLAVRRERAQIARDLHDIVSHNMAVMVVQAGAGRIAPPADPERWWRWTNSSTCSTPGPARGNRASRSLRSPSWSSRRGSRGST
jgi:signal transduction histidine kinase